MSIQEFIDQHCIEIDNDTIFEHSQANDTFYFKNEKVLFLGFDDCQDYCRIATEKDTEKNFYKIYEFWNNLSFQIYPYQS